MKIITITGLGLQFDAGQLRPGTPEHQAELAIKRINGLLQIDPFALGAQIFNTQNPLQVIEVCSECGHESIEFVLCPDGAEICNDCFKQGNH